MEIVVTLAIIGLMASVAGTIYHKKRQQEMGYQSTLYIMDEIKKAVLGENIPHNRGVNISGYVADMGNLPPLNDDSQPESLWKQTSGIKKSLYYPRQRICTGWRGPYIQEPDGDMLKDGWGNGLAFEYDEESGTLTITSFGADMKPGGTDLNADSILKIKKHHYMAPVSMSFKGNSSSSMFIINYPDPVTGALKSKELKLDKFGRFMSDEKKLFPIGLRSISARIRRGNEEERRVIVFSVQPGMNYMGVIE